MIPAGFVLLEALPLTPNGKIDRAALPGLDAIELERDGAAPRTPVEEVLVGMWAAALGLDRVGVYDNFFELGGHSLLATQLVAQLQDFFPTEVPLLSLFFEDPTVAGLGEAIIRSYPGDVDRIATILQRIASLSEEELEALLADDVALDMLAPDR
jgi:hypothetical protein